MNKMLFQNGSEQQRIQRNLQQGRILYFRAGISTGKTLLIRAASVLVLIAFVIAAFWLVLLGAYAVWPVLRWSAITGLFRRPPVMLSDVDLTNRFRTVMAYNDQCVASGYNCFRAPHFPGDVIGDYSFDTPIKPGDRLTFEDMSHYTMVKTTMFNGVKHPALCTWNPDTDELKVVKRFRYEDFRDRLS